MSENYPSDVKLNENQDGTVSFATEVVATIAGLAATEVDGVASMSSGMPPGSAMESSTGLTLCRGTRRARTTSRSPAPVWATSAHSSSPSSVSSALSASGDSVATGKIS